MNENDLDSLFSNLLITYESLPIFWTGDWHSKTSTRSNSTRESTGSNESESFSDQKILIPSFLSAMRSFSATLLGSQLAQVTMGNQKLILQSKDQYLVCMKLQEHQYQWLQQHRYFNLISQALDRILRAVLSHIQINEERPMIELSQSLRQRILQSIKTIVDETLLVLKGQNAGC